MNIYKSMLWKVAFLLMPISATSQILPETAINNPFHENACPSPEMAKMIQNIVYPINYSTGLVNISIPLYEIACGDIKLPVSLSYRASGIKLAEACGWVGQGWSLNCEPMLSQLVHGANDENFGYKCEVQPNNVDKNYLQGLAEGGRDEQPDEFFYNLLDKQGEFMYIQEPRDGKSSYLSIPFQNIKIGREGNYFRLVDDAGRIYHFDKATEYNSGTKITTMAWKPSRIIAVNGKDSISFTYSTYIEENRQCNDYIIVIDRFSEHRGLLTRRDTYQNSPNKSAVANMYPVPDYWMQSPSIYSTTMEGIGNECHTLSYQCANDGKLVNDWHPYGSQNNNHRERAFYYSQKLNRITFPQGSLTFTTKAYGNGNNKGLSDIHVRDKAGHVIKHIEMDYVFRSGRIFLSQLKISGEKGEKTQNYKFDYWEGNLPVQGSKSIDYWGYYNGIERPDSVTLVPYQGIHVTRDSMRYSKDGLPLGIVSGAERLMSIGAPLSRACNEKYMRYGTLKSITYPTGSKDVFEYEANKVSGGGGAIRTVGGLRIKRISSYNALRQCNIRTFEYGWDGNGVGVCPLDSSLAAYCIEQTKCYVRPVGYWTSSTGDYFSRDDGGYITARHRTFFANPVVPNTFSGGSAAMYECVTEYNGTKEDNAGKTVYIYDIDKSKNTPPMFSDAQRNKHIGWRTGNLLHKRVYKKENTTYKMVESEDYEYYSTTKDFGTGWCGEIWKRNILDGPEQGYGTLKYDNDIYRTNFTVGAMLLKKITHTLYGENGVANESVKTYEYNDSFLSLLRKKETLSQGGSSLQTLYEYPLDKSSTSPYAEMVARNMVTPISRTYRKDGMYTKVSTPYKRVADNLFCPTSKSVAHAENAVPTVRLAYEYDAYGNKRQITKDDKEKVVFLYGYSHQHVVAKIENATFQEVVGYIAGGESFINRLSESSDASTLMPTVEALRSHMPQAKITTYTYKPLVGLSAMTSPDGVTTHYDYDEMGRLCKIHLTHNGNTETVRQYDYHYKTE